MNRDDLIASVLAGQYLEVTDPDLKMPGLTLTLNDQQVIICPNCHLLHLPNIENRCPE